MPISIMQWRVEMGMFSRESKVRYQDRNKFDINKFDVICFSESYLDSSVASDNDD